MKKQIVFKKLSENNYLFFSLLTIVILVSFILLVPRVSTSLIPQKRTEILRSFILNTQSRQDIDLQNYWEFREFYSPGYFIYEKDGLPEVYNTTIASFAGFNKQATPQLLFTSQKVLSVGGRTKSKNFSLINEPDRSILLKTQSVVLSENENSIYLVFIKPISEMRKANGFLQHEPNNDNKFGDMWLEMAIIKKD